MTGVYPFFRLSTRAFSARLDVKVRLNGALVGEQSLRQFLCELAGVGGDSLDDLRYDWHLGE